MEVPPGCCGLPDRCVQGPASSANIVAMSYRLAIDLGSTSVTAAVSRRGEPPSVVDTGVNDPVGVKRLLREQAPVDEDGQPIAPEEVAAALIADVIRRVSELHGEPPTAVAITHAASDTPEQVDQVALAARLAGFDDADLTSEAEAAVIDHLAEH